MHRYLSLASTDVRLSDLLNHTIRTNTANLSSDVRQWYDSYDDDGFTFYFRFTAMDPTSPPFVDRESAGAYMCGQAPKLRYLCKVLYNTLYNRPENRRSKVLVFCNWPIEQWLVTSFLRTICIQVESITADMPQHARSRVVDRFNDPASDLQVLVANARGISTGVNLHRACAVVAIMGMPDNISVLLQEIGRVHRLGQLLEQEIFLLTTDHSYDQICVAKAMGKALVQSVGESSIALSEEEIQQKVNMQISEQWGNRDMTDEDMETLRLQMQSSDMQSQAAMFLCKALGMRGRRDQWTSMDLYEKDKTDDKTGQVRPMTPLGTSHASIDLGSHAVFANRCAVKKHKSVKPSVVKPPKLRLKEAQRLKVNNSTDPPTAPAPEPEVNAPEPEVNAPEPPAPATTEHVATEEVAGMYPDL